MPSQAIRPQGPNPAHWAVLQQGVAAWNAWRAAEPAVLADLSAARLAGADLTGINLRHARLLDTDLCGARLQQADLSHAWVERTLFNDALLDDAKLQGAIGSSARFTNCDLRRCSFGGGLLQDTLFDHADLRGTHLRNTDLSGSSFDHAQMAGADFTGSTLDRTRWVEVQAEDITLEGVTMHEATLVGGSLARARATGIVLTGTRILETDLGEATLCGATLLMTAFVGVSLRGADLTGAQVFGASAWNLALEGAVQRDLCITRPGEPQVTCDDLETAQFIYLLLHNAKLRQVIDTVGRKAVLLLGRFTAERKAVLDALREALRHKGWVPMLFDFDQPPSRDLTETVSTLAHLSRFVIADLTDPRSIPQELKAIVPNLPSVPVQPLLLAGQDAYAMFADLGGYASVLPPVRYRDLPHLLQILDDKVLRPAEARVAEIAQRRAAFEASWKDAGGTGDAA